METKVEMAVRKGEIYKDFSGLTVEVDMVENDTGRVHFTTVGRPVGQNSSLHGIMSMLSFRRRFSEQVGNIVRFPLRTAA